MSRTENVAAVSDAPQAANSFIKHSTIYAIGNISRQLIGFLMLPIYTRFLTPADYGAIGLLGFAIALMEPLLGARLAQAVPKFFYDEQSQAGRNLVVSTAFMITAAFSTISVAALVFFRDELSLVVFGQDRFSTVVALFATLLLTQAIEYYGLMYIRMRRAPFLFITISLAKLLMQLGLNVWLIVGLELGVMGIALSSAVSSLVFAAGLSLYTLYHTGLRLDGKLAKAMVAFCWPLWLGGLAALYIFSSNRYYMRLFSSMDEIGFYELASKFSVILTFLVWEPFMQYWQAERFVYAKQPNAFDTFRTVFKLVSTALIIVGLGISIFAGPVIHIMSDPAFYRAEESVALLTLGSLLYCLISFCQFSFFKTGETEWIGRNNVYVAILITGLNFLLVPRLGHVGAALALVCALVVQFFMVLIAGRRRYDMHLQLKPLLVSLSIACIGYVVSRTIFQFNDFLVGLIAKLVMYVAISAAIVGSLLRDEQVRTRTFALVSNVRILKNIVRA